MIRSPSAWYEMPTAPVVERYKPPTLAGVLSDKTRQNLRIAEHAHVWQAIEATATATQMSTSCPDGSESAASES
jgi:hypothetical protein